MSAINHNEIKNLVIKVKNGDSNAFSSLYEMTYQSVYFFSIYLTHDENLAYDVVQETYMHALKYINTLKDEKLFVSWLNKINYRIALKIIEKEKNINISDDEITNIVDENPHSNPLFTIMENEKKKEINELISHLPYPMRIVVIMKYFKDMKEKEIAEAIEVPIGTVKSRLNKAKKILKENLKNKGEII
ncbi:MAG: sigma-70 family RNA polymerase sigma factor [Erysipelotrichaceae bacterium]|nr:sigma-70 family RNA polymerase sigma factor [Erysipelotrichaceae bacterium]